MVQWRAAIGLACSRRRRCCRYSARRKPGCMVAPGAGIAHPGATAACAEPHPVAAVPGAHKATAAAAPRAAAVPGAVHLMTAAVRHLVAMALGTPQAPTAEQPPAAEGLGTPPGRTETPPMVGTIITVAATTTAITPPTVVNVRLQRRMLQLRRLEYRWQPLRQVLPASQRARRLARPARPRQAPTRPQPCPPMSRMISTPLCRRAASIARSPVRPTISAPGTWFSPNYGANGTYLSPSVPMP